MLRLEASIPSVMFGLQKFSEQRQLSWEKLNWEANGFTEIQKCIVQLGNWYW